MWAPEHVARAKYRLSQLIQNDEVEKGEKLKKEAKEFLDPLRSQIPQNTLRSSEAGDDMILYDYISSIWAGRTTMAVRVNEI
jgi:hypothetical protein